MLEINGSVMDNHPHPPLFCTAVTDRLVQLILMLTRPVGHMVLSKKSQSCSHTQTHTHKVIYCSHPISWTHRNIRHVDKAHQAVICRNQKSKMLNMKETHTVKAAFTPVYFILLFPPSSALSSAVLQICCTAFGLSPLCGHNSLWSGFLTCVQIGKLQDGELSLVRFMWSQGVCER